MSGALVFAAGTVHPAIEWSELTPLLILAGGAIATLVVSLFAGGFAQRYLTPLVAVATFVLAGAVFASELGEPARAVLSGSLRIDDLTRVFGLLFITAALAATVMAWRSNTLTNFGRGEFYALLISTVLGMSILASAENFITVFIAFELFSIPLYVLCAADLRRPSSLESGLKYLIIGSLGSATLLYGLALTYGATGTMDFSRVSAVIGSRNLFDEPLLLVGLALTFVGIAFKASIAPFHQWTPDVYQGAPTPVTAFMAVATKAAAFALLLRYTAGAVAPLAEHWQAPLAALAVITIAIGNFGALRQDSLKRMLAYSGVAQAGYVLIGVVVLSPIGARSTVFYLLGYLLMNVAPFAVITARERAGAGENYDSLAGIGRTHPELAWPMAVSMFALAGLPVTVGFIGKILLILAAVDGDYTWLAVVLVLGSAASLVYYLRVITTMWGSAPAAVSAPAAANASGARPERHPELVALAVVAAAATILFGFWPEPLLDLARDAAVAFFALAR